MQNLKFFALFKTLSQKESQDFHKYLKQEHDGEDVALKVFGYVKKFYPNFDDDEKLDLDYAYRKIFGQNISDKSRKNMLNTFSDLYLWLKEFLLHEKVRYDSTIREMLWLGILHERDLNSEFSKSAIRFYESKTSDPPHSLGDGVTHIAAAYFQHQHLLLPSTEPDPVGLGSCLQKIQEASDTICTRILCEQTHLLLTVPFKSDTAKNQVPLASHLRKVYEEIIQMLQQDPDTEVRHFTQAFQILTEHVASIAPSERYMIIKYLRNYAAQQVMHKNLETFGPILRQINQFGLENEAFTQKGVMSVTEFTSIVNTACVAKDFDWVDQFITTKAHLLIDDIRQNTVILAQAVLAFEQGKFKAVWQNLENVTFKQPGDYVRAKLLLIRAYYEDKPAHIDLLLECDRFDNWLYRSRKQKMQTSSVKSGTMKTISAASGFMQIFKLLLQERLDKAALLDRINDTPALFLGHWLKAKLVDYKARYAPHKPG